MKRVLSIFLSCITLVLTIISHINLCTFSVNAEELGITNHHYDYTGTSNIITAPCTGLYKITLAGASGSGYDTSKGGKGAKIYLEFTLNKGDKITLNVGGTGSEWSGAGKGSLSNGGGASSVYINNKPLAIAGGGSGAYISTTGEPVNDIFSTSDGGDSFKFENMTDSSKVNKSPNYTNTTVSNNPAIDTSITHESSLPLGAGGGGGVTAGQTGKGTNHIHKGQDTKTFRKYWYEVIKNNSGLWTMSCVAGGSYHWRGQNYVWHSSGNTQWNQPFTNAVLNYSYFTGKHVWMDDPTYDSVCSDSNGNVYQRAHITLEKSIKGYNFSSRQTECYTAPVHGIEIYASSYGSNNTGIQGTALWTYVNSSTIKCNDCGRRCTVPYALNTKENVCFADIVHTTHVDYMKKNLNCYHISTRRSGGQWAFTCPKSCNYIESYTSSTGGTSGVNENLLDNLTYEFTPSCIDTTGYIDMTIIPGVLITFDKNNTEYNIYGDKNTTPVENNMQQQVIQYDTSDTIDKNELTKEGYTFTGWNTKSDGTGVTFTDEQLVEYFDLVDKFGYTMTLYAQWKPIEYNISFENNHGTTHTGDSTNHDSSYRMQSLNNIRFDEIIQLPENEYIRQYYIEYRNTEPWLTSLKSTNGNKNSASGWVKYKFMGWSKQKILGVAPYYEFNDNDNGLASSSFANATTKSDVVNTDGKEYFADKAYLRNLTSINDKLITLYAAWQSDKVRLPENITGEDGHIFIDWSDKPYPDDRIYDMKINNNKDSNDKTVKKGTDYIPSKDTILYAHWYHQVNLTFNLNGGSYKGSPDDIVSTGTLYDYETDYTFGIFNNKTTVSKGHYDTQSNSKDLYNNEINIDAYGTYDGNGLNSLYTKIGENGEQYRLLGWSKNPNASVPDEGLCIYSATRATKYKISTSTTLYAVWEPILEVNALVQRTLGDLKFTDGSSPVTSVKAITATDAIQRLSVIAKPGEQCQYTLTTKGTDSRKANVYFDTKITDIYDINGIWTDNLNPSTSEDLVLDPPQKHGLNRTFNLTSDYIMRKFYIPLYLGTSQSYPGNSGVKEYIMFVEIQQDSYYYSLGGSKETIVIPVNIYITNDKPSGGGGTGGEYTDDKIISVLDELRSRLRVRLQ